MNRGARVAGVGAAIVIVFAATVALTAGNQSSQPSKGLSPSRSPASATSSPSASLSPSPTLPPGQSLLLPNMRSLNAGNLQIQGAGRDRQVRFSAALANVGPGPLLLRPVGVRSCSTGQHAALQLLHEDRNDDGVFQRRRDRVADRNAVGCMLKHPGHDHWHFDAMAAYSLRLPGTEEPIVSKDKVSFCLRDNRKVRGYRIAVRREHFGECRRRGVQGISPGWIDVYDADLSGQSLPVPRGVNGRLLCLDLEADPLGVLRETDETDNATSIGVRITGREVNRVSPVGCRASLASSSSS